MDAPMPAAAGSPTESSDFAAPRVALLGLGAMGRRMARRLLDAGVPLTVWNRTPSAAADLVERGARQAPTPRAAADGATRVWSIVFDDHASRRVWLDPGEGAALAMQGDAIAVESSTLSLAELYALLRRDGADMQRAHEVLRTMPVLSAAAAGAGALMLAEDYTPQAPVELIVKDLTYALQSAQAAGAALPVTATVMQRYAAARDAGFGRANLVAIARIAH